MSTSVTLKDSAELLHAIARLRTADGNSAAEVTTMKEILMLYLWSTRVRV